MHKPPLIIIRPLASLDASAPFDEHKALHVLRVAPQSPAICHQSSSCACLHAAALVAQLRGFLTLS